MAIRTNWIWHQRTWNENAGTGAGGGIESVGKNARQFRQGDQVFARTGFHLGAYAQYAGLPEDGGMAIKPANMTYGSSAHSSGWTGSVISSLKAKHPKWTKSADYWAR